MIVLRNKLFGKVKAANKALRRAWEEGGMKGLIPEGHAFPSIRGNRAMRKAMLHDGVNPTSINKMRATSDKAYNLNRSINAKSTTVRDQYYVNQSNLRNKKNSKKLLEGVSVGDGFSSPHGHWDNYIRNVETEVPGDIFHNKQIMKNSRRK